MGKGKQKDEKCIHTFYTSVWLSSISLISDFIFSPVNSEEDMENNSQSKKKKKYTTDKEG